MIAYLYLGIAILAEVIATTALRAADGFTQLWPTMLGLIASGIVMIPLGVYVFSMGERYAKRTGKLKRSG